MARKRVLEVAFPELSHENVKMTWRDVDCPGDWKLTCGSREFKVHRIIVTRGPRASAFLRAHCNQSYGAEGSDISDLLPGRCWEFVEIVLDYIYGDDLPRPEKPTDVIMLLKIADVLQIKPLFDEMMATLNDQIEIDLDDLPALLKHAWEMLPGAVTQGVLLQVSKYFCLISAAPTLAAELGSLSSETLAALFNHPDLRVRSEDDLFEFFTKTRSVLDREDDQVPWWTFIRFEHLSAQCAAAARRLLGSIPCSTVFDAMLRRREQNAGQRAATMDSKVDAMNFIVGELDRIKDARNKHTKKTLVIDLLAYLSLQGRDFLLSDRDFRESYLKKVKEFMQDHPEWRKEQVFAAILAHNLER